jgi:hypothetical protein
MVTKKLSLAAFFRHLDRCVLVDGDQKVYPLHQQNPKFWASGITRLGLLRRKPFLTSTRKIKQTIDRELASLPSARS